MSMLEELVLENRLSKGHWRVLVYLWQRHLAGDAEVNLRSLGSTQSVQIHVDHLAHRGLVCESQNGHWQLTAHGRAAFGLPGGALPVQQQPDPRHPFIQLDREMQRLALAAWWDSGAGRDKAKTIADLWRQGSISTASKELLDLAERWAEKLPDLFKKGA